MGRINRCVGDENMNDLKYQNKDEFTCRAIIVGLDKGDNQLVSFSDQMIELNELAKAAGAEVLGEVVQNKATVDVKTYIGKGKVEEVAMYVDSLEANSVIFNCELSGSQIRNLEEQLNCRIIDRTALILDIFAVRAKSGVAKLQVELAQLKYRLPRLVGLGESLSRTGGGIGTRGPGEQKLEIDRRRINKRLSDLTHKLKEMQSRLAVTKKQRIKNDIPLVALVGYTNAGKSSILNYFVDHYSEADDDKRVFQEDMLFATLDTFHRKVYIEEHKPVIMVDTVGFVSNLPHHLVEAFKATLSEALDADLLVQVIDASDPNYAMQKNVTEQTIQQLGAADKKSIVVYNKIDKMDSQDRQFSNDDICISVKTGKNIEQLIKALDETLFSDVRKVTLHIPYSEGAVLNQLINRGKVVELKHDEIGTRVIIQLNSIHINKYAQYMVE